MEIYIFNICRRLQEQLAGWQKKGTGDRILGQCRNLWDVQLWQNK